MINRISKPERGSQVKHNFLLQGNKHRVRYRTQYQSNRQYIKLTNIACTKPLDILSIRRYLRFRSNEFKVGKLKHHFYKSKDLTSHKEIPQTILGLKL